MSDFGKSLDAIRKMKWTPKYHGEVANPSRPGGKVDMWLLVDSETGDGIVSLGVPKGRSDIAGYVAAACGNPVRWVTSMWKPDPHKDGANDPQGILDRERDEIAEVLFGAYSTWMDARGKQQANGWTLNDALAVMWFAFCGQLSHEMRGRLLFKFLQLATGDYTPPAKPGDEGSIR